MISRTNRPSTGDVVVTRLCANELCYETTHSSVESRSYYKRRHGCRVTGICRCGVQPTCLANHMESDASMAAKQVSHLVTSCIAQRWTIASSNAGYGWSDDAMSCVYICGHDRLDRQFARDRNNHIPALQRVTSRRHLPTIQVAHIWTWLPTTLHRICDIAVFVTSTRAGGLHFHDDRWYMFT